MASPWTITLATVDRRRPGPVAAKSDIHDDARVPEMVANIAMSIGEVGGRFAPR